MGGDVFPSSRTCTGGWDRGRCKGTEINGGLSEYLLSTPQSLAYLIGFLVDPLRTRPPLLPATRTDPCPSARRPTSSGAPSGVGTSGPSDSRSCRGGKRVPRPGPGQRGRYIVRTRDPGWCREPRVRGSVLPEGGGRVLEDFGVATHTWKNGPRYPSFVGGDRTTRDVGPPRVMNDPVDRRRYRTRAQDGRRRPDPSNPFREPEGVGVEP